MDATDTEPLDRTESLDPKRPYIQLGERLRLRRVKIRLATSLLAERLDCTESCLQHVEQGRRLPSDDVLERWADALGIGADTQALLALQRDLAAQAVTEGLRRKAQVVRARILRKAS